MPRITLVRLSRFYKNHCKNSPLNSNAYPFQINHPKKHNPVPKNIKIATIFTITLQHPVTNNSDTPCEPPINPLQTPYQPYKNKKQHKNI